MRLLVTRPRTQAEPFAEELRALGHDAIVQPLLDYRRLPFDASALGEADALIVTSTNALRALREAEAHSHILDLPLYCAGPETAREARRLGAKKIASVGETAADLAGAILSSAPRGTRFVHLAGEHRAFEMEKALALGELSCRSLTLYTMADCERFRPDVERSLARGEIDGVVLMSPRTAEVFVAACKAAALMERARRFIYFCLSARVAEKLKCLAPMTVRVSDRADRRALVRLIGSAGTDARVGALNPLGETGCQPRCPKINDQGRR